MKLTKTNRKAVQHIITVARAVTAKEVRMKGKSAVKAALAKAAAKAQKREAALHQRIQALESQLANEGLAHVVRKKRLDEIEAYMHFAKPHVLRLVDLTLAQRDAQALILRKLSHGSYL